jgi:hypothetical protein
MTDPLIEVGILLLGMALGTILTAIRFKSATVRIVSEEIEKRNPVPNILSFAKSNEKHASAKTGP